MELLYNEQLDYWIHWYLDKANIRVRLKFKDQEREYAAWDLPSLWNSQWADNSVWAQLNKAAQAELRGLSVCE